ncbi:MAG: hypothetical protein WA579_01000, partial [Rhodomicrobium sp.]
LLPETAVWSWPALNGERPTAFAEDKPKPDKPKKNNPSATNAGIKNPFVCIGEFLLKQGPNCGVQLTCPTPQLL